MKLYDAKEKLAAGKPVFGTFLAMGSPAVAEVLAAVGFDFLVIDAEHGSAGVEAECAMLNAMKGTGVLPVIRVADNDRTVIKRALDAGPAGVMVPMIATAEDARAAVRACLYPPAGVRGVGGGHAALYGVNQAYYMDANQNLLKLIQIEHIDAVNNIDEILAVEGIDVAFVGPTDLSCSMGHMGNPGHPDVVAAIGRVTAAAVQKGVALGIYCFSVEEALSAVAQGYRFISIGVDSGLLATAASGALAAIQKHLQ